MEAALSSSIVVAASRRRRRWLPSGRNSGLLADLGLELERVDVVLPAVRWRTDERLHVTVVERLLLEEGVGELDQQRRLTE